MSKKRYPRPEQAQRALEKRYDDKYWLAILDVLSHTGVADRHQISQACDLSRDQLNSRLDYFYELAGDGIVHRVPVTVPRPGKRGQPPTVFTLGPVGADLLRKNGYRGVRPCQLQEIVAIAHARAVLDVRLAAEADGLPVYTEKEAPYSDERGRQKAIRPDNLITLPGGHRAIFEIEQAVEFIHMRRIRESLRNKVAFFSSKAGRKLSNTVRVVINLPHGAKWDETVAVWDRACIITAEESGGELPFSIVAIPLLELLAEPDWGEPPNEGRWESLIDLGQLAAFAPHVASGGGGKSKALTKTSRKRRSLDVPQSWRRRSSGDDLLVLEAFWQHFQAHARDLAGVAEAGLPPAPSPHFFQIMRLIYIASHDPNTTAWERATFPYASVYLLRKYLEMHPKLRKALGTTIARGAGSTKWNTHTIRQKMGVVIRYFLNYHGFRLGDTLRAHALAPWDSSFGNFEVKVIIDPELLMGKEDEVVPSKAEVEATEEALAWVLWAMFSHCQRLLDRAPAFW